MGADLCIQTIHMHGRDNTPIEWNRRKARMLNEIQEIDKDDINEFEENLSNACIELDVTNDSMIDIINDFLTSTDARSVTYIEIGEDIIWITGGMTWGDSPTEAYEVFEKFKCLPTRVRIAGGFE